MLDRLVVQIEPEPEENQRICSFSSCLTARNMILLGDPGAGKTELFRQAAHIAEKKYITTRNFLSASLSDLAGIEELWIDALDEVRSGRGDRNTVDRLVNRLHELKPRAVRISCRVADWLGKSDLKAFDYYFEKNGGTPLVIQLEPLTREEQQKILAQHGSNEPLVLINEAERRGLGAMLSNPQTLLMLHLAVRDLSWPDTKHDLFEQATIILLNEHNDEHKDRGDAGALQTDADIKVAAGALCALRLLSDCEGYSLQSDSIDEKTPGWLHIPLAKTEAIKEVLKRRIFVSNGNPNSVDYLHRTIAEYLGARWLAKKIVDGLPLGRVQALLGTEGRPASSLRGLHAWLAVFSSDCRELISADPMGLVMYADAAKLAPSDKVYLLSALSKHADHDPWFYHGAHSTYGIGAISDTHMSDSFREILNDPTSPLALRILVADAQARGTPIPELGDCLKKILSKQAEPFALRDSCLEALYAMGDTGRQAALSVYAEIGNDESGLRLRADMIRLWYGDGLNSDDFVQFISEMLSIRPNLSIGTTYALEKRVTEADAATILDRLDFTSIMPIGGFSHRKTYDLVRVYEGLLAKVLRIRPLPSANKIYRWSYLLMRYASSYQLNGEIAKVISGDQNLADGLLDAWIKYCDIESPWIRGWFTFRRVYADCVNESMVLARVLANMKEMTQERMAFFYGLALTSCFSNPENYLDTFWDIYKIADMEPNLISIRDQRCKCDIEDPIIERTINVEDEAYQARAEAMTHFDSNIDQIVSGEHLGWLSEIAQHYFGHFDVDDRSLDPILRLQEFFGNERTEAALAGLRSLIDKRKAPELSEILSLHAEQKYINWSLAILAVLDITADLDLESNSVNDEYIKSVVAISCLVPVYREIDNVIEPWMHSWLKSANLHRRTIVLETYASIIENELLRDVRFPDGLKEIRQPFFSGPDRSRITIKILRNFPLIHCNTLQTFFEMAEEDNAWPLLTKISYEVIGAEVKLAETDSGSEKLESFRHWLAFGYLTDPDHYQPQIEKLDDTSAKSMVWPLLRAGSLDRDRKSDLARYSLAQLEFVAVFSATYYPYVPIPTGIFSGRENDWEVSTSIGQILSILAGREDDASHAALQRLSIHPKLATYSNQARHRLAEQNVRRIDAAYIACDWQSASRTLANGAPSSAQDLHALVMDHLEEIAKQIAHGNADAYKKFWNEDRYGRVSLPKPEESARNVLLEMLRPRLLPLGLNVEREGHMARDKRADILVLSPGIKCIVELKRDNHSDIWIAAEQQLEKWYARDPEACWHGIYGVFWYGSSHDKRRSIPKHPNGRPRPKNAIELREQLVELLPADKRSRIRIIVIDVSGDTN
jgi:hypothetical protein